MKRREFAARPNVRGHLLERWEMMAARYPKVWPAPAGGVYVSPWHRDIERLRAGEPIEVACFQLSPAARRAWNLTAQGRCRVNPDNSVEPIKETPL